MHKKIIALAVAGLVSGAAFAQSNVTIYGVADVSDSYLSDNSNASTKSMNMIGSGTAGLNGSRLGFKGVEDLGNGLTANFRMEGGLNVDTGTSAQGGQLMGRWATVGLTSATLGTIEAGRRDTFHDQLLVAASGNGRGTIAQNSSVYLDQSRYNNVVAYLSPVWSGLQFKAGYASQGTDPSSAAATNAQDVVPTEITLNAQNTAANTNLRVYTAAVHYVNGPLLVGAAYDYNKLQERNSVAGIDGSYKSGSVWNIAGAYDFGIVRIDAAYGMYNYAENTQLATSAEDKDNRQQWTVGAVVPFGTKDRVMVNYAHANISYLASNRSDDSMSLWGVNYLHDLSKRTVVYAAFAKISQDDSFSVPSNKAALSTGLASGNGYQQGVQVGLRHSF